MSMPEPDPAQPAARWALILAYDGRALAGWQRQPGRETVQELIEKALALTCDEEIRVVGSGRTDAGVHAAGQVLHFDAPASRAALTPRNWVQALNTRLPNSVRVLAAQRMAAEFHARFDVVEKTYAYQLWLDGPLDPRRVGLCWAAPGQVDRQHLAQLLPSLTGRHDYSGFAARRADGSDPARGAASERLVREISLQDHGPQVVLVFRGEGFLYRMVRMLVGGLVETAAGRFNAADLLALLDQPLDQPLRKSPFCAPADGLSLERVDYGEDAAGQPMLRHPWD